MLKRLVFISLTFVSLSFAQERKANEIDSLRLQQKYQHLLSGGSEEIIPLYTLGEFHNPYDSPFEVDFLNHSSGNISELNSMSIQHIKSNINQSFAIYRQGQNKYHLGVVSDVLGYVGTAAAAGLAIYHVAKYKKMYGIK